MKDAVKELENLMKSFVKRRSAMQSANLSIWKASLDDWVRMRYYPLHVAMQVSVISDKMQLLRDLIEAKSSEQEIKALSDDIISSLQTAIDDLKKNN